MSTNVRIYTVKPINNNGLVRHTRVYYGIGGLGNCASCAGSAITNPFLQHVGLEYIFTCLAINHDRKRL